MAGLTTVGGRNMVTGFAGGLTAVVAGDTVAGDTAVIKDRIGKRVGVVAILTGITALDMIG